MVSPGLMSRFTTAIGNKNNDNSIVPSQDDKSIVPSQNSPRVEDSSEWHTTTKWFLGGDLSQLLHYGLGLFVACNIVYALVGYDVYAKAGARRDHSGNRLLHAGQFSNYPAPLESYFLMMTSIVNNDWASSDYKKETIEAYTMTTMGGSWWLILAMIIGVYLCIWYGRLYLFMSDSIPQIDNALQNVPMFQECSNTSRSDDFAAACRRMVFETTIKWISTIMGRAMTYGIGAIILIDFHGKWSQSNHTLESIDVDYIFTEAMRLSVPVVFMMVVIVAQPTLRWYVLPWLDTLCFGVALYHWNNLWLTAAGPTNLETKGPLQDAIVAFNANKCIMRQAGTSFDGLLSAAGLMTFATYVNGIVAAVVAAGKLHSVITAPTDKDVCHPILSMLDMGNVTTRIRVFNAEWHRSFVCCAIFLVLSFTTTCIKYDLKMRLNELLDKHREYKKLTVKDIPEFGDILNSSFNMEALQQLWKNKYLTKRDLVRSVTAWLVMGCLAFHGHLLGCHISVLALSSVMFLSLLVIMTCCLAYIRVPELLTAAFTKTTSALTAGVGMIEAIRGGEKIGSDTQKQTKGKGRAKRS